MLAAFLPMGLAARVAPPPRAFVVTPGRFVVPPGAVLRVVSTEAALAAWGLPRVPLVADRRVGDGQAAPGVQQGLFGCPACRIRRAGVRGR